MPPRGASTGGEIEALALIVESRADGKLAGAAADAIARIEAVIPERLRG